MIASVAGEMTPERLREFAAAYDRHDVDAIMSFFTEDCVFESPRGPEPYGRRFEGRDEVRAAVAGRFEGIPDVRYGEDEHRVCGDRGFSQWTLTGTTTEGQRLHLRGCDLFDFRDGQIAKKDSYWKIMD
jgi:steroid delta-isomerase-like uncharacterized protein